MYTYIYIYIYIYIFIYSDICRLIHTGYTTVNTRVNN